MNEIRINNSRLKLVKLEQSSEYVAFDKTEMKYQFVAEFKHLSEDANSLYPIKLNIITVYGMKSMKTADERSEYWVIKKSKEKFSVEEYTIEDLKKIMLFINATLYYSYIDTAEILVQATKEEDVINGFYRAYGYTSISKYRGELIHKVNDNEWKPKMFTGILPVIEYTRDKYSIQKLLSELVEDNAEILIDKDLVGEYNRIGKKVIYKDDFIDDNSKWQKVTGILGNQQRANLSLSIDQNVIVNIPDNPFDIAPGGYSYKRKSCICIIKDGLLNQKYLGVKVSPKFAGKLKRLKIVVAELMRENEYCINLSYLPIISKSWLREISPIYLANLEVNLKLTSIALEYLDIYHPEKKQEQLGDKEKFLQSIGIFGEYYIPINTTTSRSGERNYSVGVIKTSIPEFPTNKQSRLENYRLYHDYYNNSTCNKVIKNYFDSIKINQNSEELRKTLRKENKRYLTEMRDRKFQMIMRKVCRFSSGELIENKSVLVNCHNCTFNVSWKFDEKLITEG